MRWIADAVYLFAGLLYLPVALYHALIIGKNRRGWGQRFGSVPTFDPTRRRIWIHAVSLGEVNATPGLVAALQQRCSGVDVVVSTTTDTGYARAAALYGEGRVFHFPLDFSLVVTRALRRIRPSLIVLVELEVWYNLTRMAARAGVAVAVVNGRMTQRSARRLRRLGSFARTMFRDLTWVGAQDNTIAARFREMGVPPERVEVTSSLKWDTAAVTDRVEGSEELAASLGLDGSRPIWVCGSTGDGEETLILDAYRDLTHSPADQSRERERADAGRVASAPRSDRPMPRLVLVPRKPERFDEVARLIESRGYECIRRSEHADRASPGTKERPRGVVLGDTMGELRKFYCLADAVFVGRSLVPLGGSDPMEVAALAKAMIVGPHMENFDAPLRALREASAVRGVDSPASLAHAVEEILANPTLARSMGEKGRQVVLQNQGATARTVDRLVELLAGRGG